MGIFEVEPLGIEALGSAAPFQLLQGVRNLPPVPSSVDADGRGFSVYSGLPDFVPLFNVDVGAIAGTPSTSYAAAGSAGVWNPIGLDTTSLVTASGLASMAKATLTTQSDKGLGPGSPPDAQALMGDFGVDCDTVTWMLELDGLLDGLYRVWVYARSTAGVSTGDVTVFQGAALAELPGSTGAQLQPGVSVALGDALVTKGTLQIEGQGTGAFACVGIAGVQLERQLAPPAGVPVPALSSGSLALLVLGLLGAGGCALGRWGVRAT